MQVTVKLFSVLRQYWPGYDPETGVRLELSPASNVTEMLALLNIPADKSPVVACNGLILKAADRVPAGGVVHIFQPVSGG